MAEAPDRSAEGLSAFREGDFAAARTAFEAMLAEQEVAQAHEMLAALCLILEDLDATRRHGEAAYRLYLQAGNPCRAAAAALTLASMHEWLGHDLA
ncbi:MAG: hypothetical protein ABR532_05575, partial [Candidatus Dormibacteria bacterium]